MKFCYQCDAQVTYLFADARCAKCTRLTPEEVRGEPKENPMRQSQIKNVAKNGRTVTLTVTEWIANEKGLI